jgi:phosphohistidine phosphatase
MDLLLIRHAKAEAHGHPQGDGARALIEKGRDQSRRVGEFLKNRGMVPDIVLTSPLARARETAEIVSEVSGADPPVLQDWLACGMEPSGALQELAAYATSCDRVAIVGHEPDFSGLVEYLLGTSRGFVRVKKASVVLLRINPPHRGGVMQFNIWPTMLP